MAKSEINGNAKYKEGIFIKDTFFIFLILFSLFYVEAIVTKELGLYGIEHQDFELRCSNSSLDR